MAVLVDMQEDVMNPAGPLYVNGADVVRPIADQFLARMSPADIEAVAVTMDTHEPSDFPSRFKSAPHCLAGTPGWGIAIDIEPVLANGVPVFAVRKPVNDMWSGAFPPDIFEVHDAAALQGSAGNILPPGKVRDAFMDEKDIGPGTEILMGGFVSNYCFHDALLGFLKRGCKVTILEDLCRGFVTPPKPDRASSGDVRDVIKLDAFQPYLESGQIRVASSEVLFRGPLVEAAYHVAEKAHATQVRSGSNKPYIHHPLKIYSTLRSFGITDQVTLAAALLHDVREDCKAIDSRQKLIEALQEELKNIPGGAIDETLIGSTADTVEELTNLPVMPEVKRSWQVDHAATMSDRAKIIKIMDQAANVGDLTFSSKPLPVRRAYVEKARDVADACAGAHAGVDGYFALVQADVAARLAKNIPGNIDDGALLAQALSGVRPERPIAPQVASWLKAGGDGLYEIGLTSAGEVAAYRITVAHTQSEDDERNRKARDFCTALELDDKVPVPVTTGPYEQLAGRDVRLFKLNRPLPLETFLATAERMNVANEAERVELTQAAALAGQDVEMLRRVVAGMLDGRLNSSLELEAAGLTRESRAAVYGRMIGLALPPAPPAPHKVMLCLGGGPVSGKSAFKTAISDFIAGEGLAEHAVYVIPQDVKDMLPEYRALGSLSGNKPLQAALDVTQEQADRIGKKLYPFFATEVSQLSDKIIGAAMRRGCPVVVESHMSDRDESLRRVKLAKDNGYESVLVNPVVSIFNFFARGEKRQQDTGKWFVPEGGLESQKRFEENWPEYARAFDLAARFNNNSAVPRLMALALKGDIHVFDATGYAETRAKININPRGRNADEALSTAFQGPVPDEDQADAKSLMDGGADPNHIQKLLELLTSRPILGPNP
ncbi:MAG TPA: zeta toxin family protein [Patescibacteria group bacterium]|nr:zeta toxin family protein [Patescibacteria group bacterium]